jgi:hypothetical protein
MVAKLTRLTQNIAYWHLVAESYIVAIFIPSGEFGNLWICHFMSLEFGTGLNGMYFIDFQIIQVPAGTIIVTNFVHSCQIEVTV